MVRTYKKKTKGYTEADIKSALRKLDEGSSYRQVAAISGISKSSLELYRKESKRKKKKYLNLKPRGRKPTLTRDEEEKIVTVVSTAAEMGWPVDRKDVGEIIGNYCAKVKRKTQFKNNKPGSDFLISFFKRHKNRLTIKKSKSLKIVRAAAEHPDIISNYIDLVGEAYAQANINVDKMSDRERVFSLDESGFRGEAQPKMVIVPVGKPANILTATEGKTNYSVLIGGNAAGIFIPPYIIYKSIGKNIPFSWVLNGVEDAVYNTSKNGWMNQEIFIKWIPWFDDILTKKGIEKPVVVLMDGCTAHVSLAIVEEARKRNIILVKLPPNSTHVLQALDVTVFGSCKSTWTDILRDWSRQSRYKPVTKSVFHVLFAKLFAAMIAKPEVLISGFRTTGVWLLNKKKILDKVEERGLYKAAYVPNPSESTTSASANENQDDNEASTSDGVTAGSSTAQETIEIIQSVKAVLNPPQDSFTKKAIENSKNTTKVKKKFAEIITSDEAIAAMKSKDSKGTKKGKKKAENKRDNENEKQQDITKYFKKKDSDEDYFDSSTDVKEKLKLFWKSISPPVKEDEVLGKWFIAIYKDPKPKGRQTYCIGRAKMRFLDEADGKVSQLQLDCLKPRVGNTTVLQEYPEGRSDIDIFNVTDVFGGPIDIKPLPKKKWDVPNLLEIIKFYEIVVKIDRIALFNTL